MKFMMLVKAKEQGPPPAALMEAIGRLAEEDAKAGRKILASGGLASISQGASVRIKKGELTVTDGPFAEAKEVVGGYAQFELSSKQEAIDGAVRFMELHRKHWPEWEGETEIRQMLAPEDFQTKGWRR